ncbi:MAG: phosphoribosylglycinamide formyltransferase [Micrococcales bacterium]|nr:phosphoribosylglycinamide formyltransferase [Micrococcales bacterium]
METAPLRLVILASGAGSLARAVLEAAAQPAAPFLVVGVGADRPAPVLAIAREHGVPTFTVAPGDFPTRALWDEALTRSVATFRPDAVVSAGFMRILGPAFLAAYQGRTLNTHPALLPAFPGNHAVADALAAGATQTGCTIHWVDAGVDTGPVVDTRHVAITPDDTVDTLHERIKIREREMLTTTLARLARGDLAFPQESS